MPGGRPVVQLNKLPKCEDKRPCFAKIQVSKRTSRCSILNHTGYADGACPFCKEHEKDPDMVRKSGTLTVKSLDGGTIILLSRKGKCLATGKSPLKMNKCPLSEFSDDGGICFPALCNEYRE